MPLLSMQQSCLLCISTLLESGITIARIILVDVRDSPTRLMTKPCAVGQRASSRPSPSRSFAVRPPRFQFQIEDTLSFAADDHDDIRPYQVRDVARWLSMKVRRFQ